MTRISDFLTSGAERAASRQQSKKTHTEKVGESRSPKQMTKDAKKAQKKAAKEAGKGFKDSFKDTVRSVKSAGKTLLNATGINGKQKKEQAVGKIYGITRGIGTTIAHPIRSVKEIASAIREKAKEKGESYVGGYILGEVTQTAAAAGAAAAAGKGLKGAKAAKKTKPKKSNGLADVGSTGSIYKEIKAITAEETNQWFIDNVKMDYKPPYKQGTIVKEIELNRNTIFIRVYDNAPDGSGMYGSWLMKAEDIKGLTPSEIKDKFALPNIPKYVCDVELEAGTHIRMGEVNPLDGWGSGGGTQYDLIGQRIGNFKNERFLEEN